MARFAVWLGGIFLNRFETPVITGTADMLADGVQLFGRNFRVIQTGKVQQYMLLALVNVIAFGLLFYFLLGQ